MIVLENEACRRRLEEDLFEDLGGIGRRGCWRVEFGRKMERMNRIRR